MRGSIIKRSKTSWALVVDRGRAADGKRRQKWVRFAVPRNVSQREALKQAEAKLAELLHQIDKGSYVDPSRITLIEHLRDWLKKAAQRLRPESARVYKSFVEGHVSTAAIAHVPIQRLRPSELESFYATSKLAPRSVAVLHAVIHRALRMAVRDGLIVTNPATAAENRPKPSKDYGQGARAHCWTAAEARAFLAAASEASSQASAFCALALDTGARKSELFGLTWADVDLTIGAVTIARQLDKAGTVPTWGPTKTDHARTVPLGPETVTRLKVHRRTQAELKLKNRTAYTDFGLVFAREPEDLQTPTAALGQPLTTLSEGRFRRVVATAGIRLIKFHGLRHTCATLLLQAGNPVHVVAQRLGHAQASMTLEVYAHALPSMQQQAAVSLDAVLHG